jgi:arylformamidase
MTLSGIATKFARVILVSGIFDLEPTTRTSVNEATRLDTKSAERLSPINFISQALDTPLTIIWGENETDEFKRQSRDFASAWNKETSHSAAITQEITERNHFDILYELPTKEMVGSTGA